MAKIKETKKWTPKPKSRKPGVHSKNNKPVKRYRGQGRI